jgi:tyrosyl-DNA phosphodiesterase 2
MNALQHRSGPWSLFFVSALGALGAAGEAPPPVAQAPPARLLTFVTYNVLAEKAPSPQRRAALLKILQESDADLIALQEVDETWLGALREAEWIRRSYAAASSGDRPLVANGNLILSKLPIQQASSMALPGKQGRAAVKTVCRVDGRPLAVVTAHLEAPLEAGPIRAAQLDAMFNLLKDEHDAVLLGDFNFGDGEEPDTSHLDKAFVDLWLALRPGEAGFTWNIEASEMARKGSFPKEKSRRIDRILLRSDAWRPKSIRIVGDQPVRPEDRTLFPSDHFGLAGSIERRP